MKCDCSALSPSRIPIVLVVLVVLAFALPSAASAATASTAGATPLPASPAGLVVSAGQGCRVYSVSLSGGQRVTLNLDPYSDFGVRADLYRPGTAEVSADFEHGDAIPNLLATCGYGDFANGYFGTIYPDGCSYDVPSGAGGTYYIAFVRDPHWLTLPENATLTYSVITPSGPVTGLSATPTSTTGFEFAPWKVALKWHNPTDSRYADTRIVRGDWYESDEGSVWDYLTPDHDDDSTTKRVYDGTDESCVDTIPVDGARYAYAAWTQDDDGDWSVVATTTVYYPARKGPQFPGLALPAKWNTLQIMHAADPGSPSFSYYGEVYHVSLAKGQMFAADLYGIASGWRAVWDIRAWGPSAKSPSSKPLHAKTIKSKADSVESPQIRFVAPSSGTYYLQARCLKPDPYGSSDWLDNPTYLLSTWKGPKGKVTAKTTRVTVTTNSAGNTFIDAYGKATSTCADLVPPNSATGVKLSVYAKGRWNYNYTFAADIDTHGKLWGRIDMPPRSAGKVMVRFLIQPLGLCNACKSSVYVVRR